MKLIHAKLRKRSAHKSAHTVRNGNGICEEEQSDPKTINQGEIAAFPLDVRNALGIIPSLLFIKC